MILVGEFKCIWIYPLEHFVEITFLRVKGKDRWPQSSVSTQLQDSHLLPLNSHIGNGATQSSPRAHQPLHVCNFDHKLNGENLWQHTRDSILEYCAFCYQMWLPHRVTKCRTQWKWGPLPRWAWGHLASPFKTAVRAVGFSSQDSHEGSCLNATIYTCFLTQFTREWDEMSGDVGY